MNKKYLFNIILLWSFLLNATASAKTYLAMGGIEINVALVLINIVASKTEDFEEREKRFLKRF
jgi:hypothetical protein